MSNTDIEQINSSRDWNETAMSIFVYVFFAIIVLSILGFGYKLICQANHVETFDDDNAGNDVLNVSISKERGNIIDVTLKKDRVPIDYWIFQRISDTSRTPGASKIPVQIYMTDLSDSTFSNQNLRALINDVLDSYDTDETRVLINWIFNHSRFTSSLNKRYRMYNLYKKYFPLPLEADDYEAPLLDSAGSGMVEPISKDPIIDIASHNFLDVPETTKVMCSDQLFVEQDRKFSLYCNGDYLQYSDRPDNYVPVVARYYLVVVIDPKPMFSYTSDGLVPMTHTSISSTNSQDDEYVYDGTAEETVQKEPQIDYVSLSSLIRPDPEISWHSIQNRVDKKLSKLGELMILEHRQESTIDRMDKLLRRTNVDLYQTFAIDVVVRGGEPFIFKITASPTFREYGHEIAHDMLDSMIERTKLMLSL